MTHNSFKSITYLISGRAALGAGLMLLAGLLFAIINTLVQSASMQFGTPSTTIAFWQYLIALLFSIPWILSRWRQTFRTAKLPLHILRVAFAAFGVQFWVMGLASVPIWQAVALIMTSPFFVTLGAGLILRERVSAERWLAVLLGFTGGMIILAPWSDSFSTAAFYPLGAALLWALSSLVTKHLTETEQSDTLTLYLLLLLTPINAILAFETGFSLPSADTTLIIVAAGIFTAAAQYALVRAYSIADAAYLQPFDHVKLVFNVVLGWITFGFLPDGNMWAGALLIVFASLFLLNREARQEEASVG